MNRWIQGYPDNPMVKYFKGQGPESTVVSSLPSDFLWRLSEATFHQECRLTTYQHSNLVQFYKVGVPACLLFMPSWQTAPNLTLKNSFALFLVHITPCGWPHPTRGLLCRMFHFLGTEGRLPVRTEGQKMGQITVLGICIKQLGTISAGVAELVGHSLEL